MGCFDRITNSAASRPGLCSWRGCGGQAARAAGPAVTVTAEQFLGSLAASYSGTFDRFEPQAPVPGLAAAYAYHCTNECYVLSQKVKLWQAENHEFVYVIAAGDLRPGELEPARQAALAEGLARIRPHIDHMASFVTVIFVCDRLCPEAAEAVRKVRMRKNYKLTLHGWMEHRVAAVELSTQSVVTNRAGAQLVPMLVGNLETLQKKIKQGDLN